MEMVTNIVNIPSRRATPPAGTVQVDARLLERMRTANANLQREVLSARGKALEAMMRKDMGAAAKVSTLTGQLDQAKKTIAELEKKVKDLTRSLEDSLSHVTKKDKKQDKAEKTEKTGATGTTSTFNNGGMTFSVN